MQDTKNCIHLKREIDMSIERGHLKRFIAGKEGQSNRNKSLRDFKGSRGRDWEGSPRKRYFEKGDIFVIFGGAMFVAKSSKRKGAQLF